MSNSAVIINCRHIVCTYVIVYMVTVIMQQVFINYLLKSIPEQLITGSSQILSLSELQRIVHVVLTVFLRCNVNRLAEVVFAAVVNGGHPYGVQGERF